MWIARDINRICKKPLTTTELLKLKQQNILNYYNEHSFSDDKLLKRLKHICYTIDYGRSSSLNIFFGFISGSGVSILFMFFDKLNFNLPPYHGLPQLIINIAFLILTLLVIILLLSPLLGMIGLSYLYPIALYKNDYDLFLIKYERTIIINILRDHNIDLTYIQ